jgi:hypothetical protein
MALTLVELEAGPISLKKFLARAKSGKISIPGVYGSNNHHTHCASQTQLKATAHSRLNSSEGADSWQLLCNCCLNY